MLLGAEGGEVPSSLFHLREQFTSKMVGMRIEPAWLEEGKDTATCPLCFLVLDQPTSGCPEGHALCNECYVEELTHRERCPTCRHPTNKSKCVSPLVKPSA